MRRTKIWRSRRRCCSYRRKKTLAAAKLVGSGAWYGQLWSIRGQVRSVINSCQFYYRKALSLVISVGPISGLLLPVPGVVVHHHLHYLHHRGVAGGCGWTNSVSKCRLCIRVHWYHGGDYFHCGVSWKVLMNWKLEIVMEIFYFSKAFGLSSQNKVLEAAHERHWFTCNSAFLHFHFVGGSWRICNCGKNWKNN